MTKAIEKGHFYVGELPDGRFVAASNSSPFFCFRGESEDAVFAKVDAALTFYCNSASMAHLEPRSATATVSAWKNQRAVPFKEYAAAVA